jgi:uncharacterized membrane protein YeaQ/YmgE (transglycosylase-associated protein family)
VILLIVAGICGALGRMIVGDSRGGFLLSIVIGFIGALLGMAMARALNLPEVFAFSVGGSSAFPILWSIIGAAVFVAIIHLLSRGRA